MKKPAKRRAAQKAAPPQSLMRLPMLSAPVIRGVATDPVYIGLGTSSAECMQCLLDCRKLGGPLQPICESLCSVVCQ